MKLTKKVYVYGAIVGASLTLLGSQALVKKPERPVRPAAPVDATNEAHTSDESTPMESSSDDLASVHDSGSGDERVERLGKAISALQALLPEDRSQELDAIGRSWAAPAPAIEPETADPVRSETQSAETHPEPAPFFAPPPAVGGASEAPLSAAPAVDPLQVWLSTNPVTAIALTQPGGLAVIGGQFYRVGDALPLDLGTVRRIDARSVVISHGELERKIPLSAFIPRPLPEALAPPSSDTASRAASAPVASSSPETNSIAELLKDAVNKISAPIPGSPDVTEKK